MGALFRAEQILEKKSALFSVVVAGVVGILAVPVILPHVFHGFHMAHILLHIGGITLAAFLTILSLIAYHRLRTNKLLITTFAFSIFVLAEVVTLIDATWPSLYDIGNLALLEVGHLLMIASLGLLAMGVFRND
ncbi:hypothetical protein CENSYa_1789 [Cenarchaeum symbiosum A]|uniref:Uncharacterized protein n=1 Tax=Cenarchaeum symbiosum (strain A) TaxID=414004 RepID=A0RYI2_CENSY|nr:hypothetical protein CENSYa_1789 [Cenarchaeum symbiosum A]